MVGGELLLFVECFGALRCDLLRCLPFVDCVVQFDVLLRLIKFCFQDGTNFYSDVCCVFC